MHPRLVALAHRIRSSSHEIASWITDTFFEAVIMVFCAVTLVQFRLSPGEDLNLVPLLPVTTEFGALPAGPSGFNDELEAEDNDLAF